MKQIIEFSKQEIEGSISDRFEKVANFCSQQIAIKTENETINYENLNKKANQLARSILKDYHLENQSTIILLDHEISIITSILAILKTRNFYTILDSQSPQERLKIICDESKAKLIITNFNNLTLANNLAENNINIINIDTLNPYINEDNLGFFIAPNAIASLVFTSGSTGKPKGIITTHSFYLDHIYNTSNKDKIQVGDSLTTLLNYSFSGSLNAILTCLLNGGTLVTYNFSKLAHFPLKDWLQENKINYFICTSQVFYQLIDSLDKTTFFSCLRQIMIVTDKLYTKEVERFWQKVSSNCILKHGYGSSETNGIAIIYLQRNSLISSKIIPAGYPIKEVKILDEQGQNLDVNEVGEIAVKSSYLSPGYWQNPQLTKEKFLPVPNDKDSRIYLTGDLGRINSDGYLEIVSRKDLMVKIRGFRIELGEIEANLKEHPKIKQTLVITQENTLEDKKIVSYFVPINNQNIYPQQLREFLKERLPHYQIPSAFVCLDSFPLTASGKIDLKSLPKVDWTTLIQQNFVAPRDEVELQLTKIWEKVLDIQPIGVKDNFFDLGGHSLLAVKLLAQIEKTMAKTLPLATLFQAPTVEELANLVQQKGKSLPWSALIPIQPNGSKPPFFCVHGGGGNILNFYPLANELGSDQPFYGLQAKGVDGQQKPYSCIEDMATHYLEEIFTIQPEGPYFLGGYCFGSLVAFEIAQQLLTKNQKVALLVFFDPIPYYKPISIKEKLFHHLVLLFQIGPTYLLKKIKKIMSQKPNKDFERAIQPETPQSIKIAHLQAYNNYVPLSYPGQVLVFSTNQEDKHQNQYWNAKIGWGSLMTKGLKFHYVYADHISLLKKPHVKELAEKLRDCIDWTLEKEIGSTGTLKELINKFDKPYE